jgi:hypothetical protein
VGTALLSRAAAREKEETEEEEGQREGGEGAEEGEPEEGERRGKRRRRRSKGKRHTRKRGKGAESSGCLLCAGRRVKGEGERLLLRLCEREVGGEETAMLVTRWPSRIL